ncbi:MAG: sulfur carrier protein ThiS [Campylobacterales bacterium]|nr:sulfur carrier protein ThiS [Campylobacterales bacterium]
MNIIVNGQNKEVESHTTLEALIESLNLGINVMASAVNMEIVKKQDWGGYELQEGDKVDLLDFVGGG